MSSEAAVSSDSSEHLDQYPYTKIQGDGRLFDFEADRLCAMADPDEAERAYKALVANRAADVLTECTAIAQVRLLLEVGIQEGPRMAAILGRPESTIRSTLNRLRDDGVVKIVGASEGGVGRASNTWALV